MRSRGSSWLAWRRMRQGAVALALGALIWSQPGSTWGREMNDTLLNRFTQAFNGSAVDSAAMNRVYQRWIELRRESLEDLPASLRDEVLSDLVADRARAIADSSAEMRPAQLEHDRIWTEFWPIDKESETFAHQVKA